MNTAYFAEMSFYPCIYTAYVTISKQAEVKGERAIYKIIIGRVIFITFLPLKKKQRKKQKKTLILK